MPRLQAPKKVNVAALKKVFARGAFSAEGLDRYKLFNLLRKGKAVLAAKAP